MKNKFKKKFSLISKKMMSFLLAILMIAEIMPATNANAASVPLADGYYYIANGLKSNDTFMVDIAGGSTAYGANVQMYQKNRSLRQVYHVYRNSDGSYTIKNVKSGLVLDVQNGWAKQGQNVQQYKANSSKAQKWYLESAGNGYFYLRSGVGSFYADVAGGLTANSTNFQIWTKNGTKAQQFKFIPVIQGCNDSINGEMNTVTVNGWAFSDLNFSEQLKITVSFAGRTFTTTAKSYRPDVNGVYGCGVYHGYSASFTVQGLSGNHTVTVKATDSAGRTRTLAQKTVYIKPDNYNPAGNFDLVEYSNGAAVIHGWTWDQSDPGKSIDYAVFFNGQYAGSFKANKARTDLRNVLPGQAGVNHGFIDTVKLPAGMKGLVKVTVTGINVGGGENTLIGEKLLLIKPDNVSYANKATAFINDLRWKNGSDWSANQTPKFSSHASWGCCAYTADFAKVVFGKSSQSSGTAFKNVREIRAGDIIYVNSDGKPHWFVVLDRNGSSLITAEGNWQDKVVISSNTYSIVNNSIYRGGKYFRAMQTSYHYLSK